MNNLIVKSLAILTLSWMLIGCNSDNTGTTTMVKKYNVSGSVVDGPIYGATVTIVDVNDSTKIYGTTTTDENGTFNISDIAGLPAVYRVVITDGKDSGVDTQVDENDDNSSFEMSAMVKRDDSDESNTSTANVSPATTLVDKLVEDGKIPLDEAETRVANSLGLDTNTSLSKVDNRENSVGNKAGNFIGTVARITPVEDKNLVIDAIVKLIINGELNVTITDTRVDISQFEMMIVLKEVNKTTPLALSPDDVFKMEITQDLIKENIASLLETIKTADTVTDDEKKEALSTKIALDTLIQEIRTETSDGLDISTLKRIVNDTKEVIKGLIENQGTSITSDETIKFVKNLIKGNFDKDIKDIKEDIIKAAEKFHFVIRRVKPDIKITTKLSITNMITLVYANSDLNNTDKISDMLDDTFLDELATSADAIAEVKAGIVETGEIPQEVGQELEDTVAEQIAGVIETGEIPTVDNVKTMTDNSVKNPLLVETLTTKVKVKVNIKVKAKTNVLSQEDNINLVASTQVITNIKVHVKVKTTFNETNKGNCDKYETHIKETLVNNQTNIKIAIQSVNIERVNLDLNDINYTTQSLIDVVNTISTKVNVDSIKTISTIKIKIEEDFTNPNITSEETLTTIQDDLPSYEQLITIPKRTLSLPQPSLKDMPTEFATPIEVTL
jgi:polyhydroxyalkanoate synthesis regulator phasin